MSAMAKRFEGTIGRTFEDSEAWWPPRERAPEGAPNIVMVLLDDVGYAQFGCYGSDIATPTFDRLAAGGLRYSNFHTTALCSPTRACLLTGRNHHANGMARIVEFSSGFPGYDATIPPENGFLSEILLRNGYATFAVGKWHLAPATEMSCGGPRTHWPLGKGFERFYGFLAGETDQYHPDLVARQPPGAAAAHARRGLPPHRGSRRPRHRLPEGPARLRPRQAVPPVLRARRLPRAASGAGVVHRAVPRPLRSGLGRMARRRVRAAGRVGPAPAGHRAVRAPVVGAGVGVARAPTSAGSTRG